MGKRKINTFTKSMSEEEAQREMQLSTPVGESLKKAEREYSKRRKK